MDQRHNKTHKQTHNTQDADTVGERFQALLENGAEEAYKRPWHRIERGLRLNRLRIFIEEISHQYQMTEDEKKAFFVYLQKALDNKLLNTIKVVQYNPDTQRIATIRGLELKRNQENVLKWILRQKVEGTRKKKVKDELVATSIVEATQN